MDNGRFAEKEFRDKIHNHNQSIMFYTVDIHYQNRIAEYYIRKIATRERIMLLYTKQF